jgi:hypothetical protein
MIPVTDVFRVHSTRQILASLAADPSTPMDDLAQALLELVIDTAAGVTL